MADKKEYFYFIDIAGDSEKIALLEKGTVTRNGWTSDYKTIQLTGTNNISIKGIWLDDDLVAGTLTGTYSNIPLRFHEAIVNKVISIGYKDPRNLNINNAQFFDLEFTKGMKKAKKFARSNYATLGRVVPNDF
jgi:hypothetical protein|tara:strand:+ start:276 stop:674 length:399 start_codon:yes stop_codon:yes gene_type:complete